MVGQRSIRLALIPTPLGRRRRTRESRRVEAGAKGQYQRSPPPLHQLLELRRRRCLRLPPQGAMGNELSRVG